MQELIRSRRTPAQDNVLRAYRLERSFGYPPLEAIKNVRAARASTIAILLAAGHSLATAQPVLEEWRAADIAVGQIAARAFGEPVTLRTISRKRWTA